MPRIGRASTFRETSCNFRPPSLYARRSNPPSSVYARRSTPPVRSDGTAYVSNLQGALAPMRHRIYLCNMSKHMKRRGYSSLPSQAVFPTTAPAAQTTMDDRVRELNNLCQQFQASNPGLDVNTAMQAAIAALQSNQPAVRTTPGIFFIPPKPTKLVPYSAEDNVKSLLAFLDNRLTPEEKKTFASAALASEGQQYRRR